MRVFALGFILCCLFPVYSQNLIPNPGFEEFNALPNADCQWYFVENWDNVNGKFACDNTAGSPDYFHTFGANFNQLPNTNVGNVQPLEGEAVMGITTYARVTADFREYISVELTEPLQMGTAYTLTLNYTNGNKGLNSFGGLGTPLGVHLSMAPLVQNGIDPILINPIFQSADPFYSNDWKQINIFFIPLDNYTHLTIGNFLNDANTNFQLFDPPSSPNFPYAYFFLDNIQLKEEPVLSSPPISFKADVEGAHVTLHWQISDLPTDATFHIERASQHKGFKPIGTIKGSAHQLTYSHTDPNPPNGHNTYRLTTQLADGNIILSEPQQVMIDGTPHWHIYLTTNLTETQLHISHDHTHKQPAMIRVFNIQGKMFMKRKVQIDKELHWDLTHFERGYYIIHLITQDQHIHQKILIP